MVELGSLFWGWFLFFFFEVVSLRGLEDCKGYCAGFVGFVVGL